MATTTPNYGWDVPTSTDYVKDGATAIETLGDDIDATLWTALGGAYPGLRLIKKQTIGSAVSSVTVTNAFSATYDNYKIVVSGGTATVNDYMRMTLGASTANYYSNRVAAEYGSSTISNATNNNGGSWSYPGYMGITTLMMNVELLNPFLTKPTIMTGSYATLSSFGVTTQGQHAVSTSYTDFSIIAASGTMTGGTIYVYGYGAS